MSEQGKRKSQLYLEKGGVHHRCHEAVGTSNGAQLKLVDIAGVYRRRHLSRGIHVPLSREEGRVGGMAAREEGDAAEEGVKRREWKGSFV